MQSQLTTLREEVRAATCTDEALLVESMVAASQLSVARRERVLAHSTSLVERCRGKSHKAGTLDAFLQEFGLSNKEGIALMCLAEALLRVPDDETADALIAEKINSGDWGAHKGKSASGFVNASVWGLMLTGRVVKLDDSITGATSHWMQRLVSTLGEPVVRMAVLQAMRIMGGQYVLGRTIEEGLRKGIASNVPGTRFSFDMLGEGARTAADAERYFAGYCKAIEVIGATPQSSDVADAEGISVKLSALHPRYEFHHKRRVMDELLPRVKQLALRSKQAGIGFSIDAEESDRLDLSLDLFEALARDPELADWDGLGFVLQAYLKRSWKLADWLLALAQETGRRFMVRLVKGAYWDGEIKHAQKEGLNDYPVFTRKYHSDVCYQLCAEKLLAGRTHVYPQFATHNAHTIALVYELAGAGGGYEFQRLHGMGQLLFEELQQNEADWNVPIRVYAPIGEHRDLLPYLVRRLLENGANSSFVNRFLDLKVPATELMRDPLAIASTHKFVRHPQIPLPRDLYRDAPDAWKNARGIDLNEPTTVTRLLADIGRFSEQAWQARPIVGGEPQPGEELPVMSPSDCSKQVGDVVHARAEHVERALTLAVQGQPHWDRAGGAQRADCLDRAADLMEEHCCELMALISAEAGRTLADALSEVREAVDFCRYYGQRARLDFAEAQVLPGPTGELNTLSLHGRGVFLCISPWNFPLAIFVGQIAAALLAGNSVIAKPAEQTPLVASRAIQLILQAGVPADNLHLLPGDGAELGAILLSDQRIGGVVFTGSTETAHIINRQLAARPGAIVPLIAETGGLNVMLVDTTALPEQVVDDTIASAFRSAGQRCSALRVLYLQEEVADSIIEMLAGAMQELDIGNASALATDVGPVIDEDARTELQRYVEQRSAENRPLAACTLDEKHAGGCFVAPTVFEISSLSDLPGEVFGPILHVIRYSQDSLDEVLASVNASGFGLTLGVHSRIDAFSDYVFNRTRVGNTYINRDMVGAVVGVNPFGGQGLSGTGPKAGGPNYLKRFGTERTRTDNIVARGGNTQLFNLSE